MASGNVLRNFLHKCLHANSRQLSQHDPLKNWTFTKIRNPAASPLRTSEASFWAYLRRPQGMDDLLNLVTYRKGSATRATASSVRHLRHSFTESALEDLNMLSYLSSLAERLLPRCLLSELQW